MGNAWFIRVWWAACNLYRFIFHVFLMWFLRVLDGAVLVVRF